MSTPQGPFPPNGPIPGQQPGQQFGQPGQQFDPQNQQFQGQQFQGQPMGQQPKKSIVSKLRLGGSVIIAIAVGAGLLWNWYDGSKRDKALTVGQCVNVTGEENKAEVEPTDCGADATKQVPLRVVEKHDGAAQCKDDTLTYEETSRRRRSGTERTNKTVCLAPVFEQGKSYKVDDTLSAGFREVKSAGEADFTITKVEESADAQCSSEEHTWAITKWPRTYCMAEA